jgi:hypothetical protein
VKHMTKCSNRTIFFRMAVVASAICASLLFNSDVLAQCAMCRTALTQSPEGLRWSRGINAGIMLLLAAPFLIAGCGLAVIYKAQLLGWLRGIRTRLAESRTFEDAKEAAGIKVG